MPISNQCLRSVNPLCWLPFGIVALAAAVALPACHDSGAAAEIVFGEVRCGGQPVDTGEVRLVPIQGTLGWVSSSRILDGVYRIDARGGVPVGTYRVEVDALRKTGRKMTETFNAEKIHVDQTKPVGLKSYRDESSPLTLTVPTENEGRYDIDLPREPDR